MTDDEIDNGGDDEDDHDIETVEVCDNIPPVLAGIPLDITIECNETVPTAPGIGTEITASDESNLNVTIVLTEVSTQGTGDDCTDFNYTITRTWVATDECANESTATQVITVQDTAPPAITAQAQPMIVECNGFGNGDEFRIWLESNGGAIATDLCGDVIWTNDAGTFSDDCGLTGSQTVTFTATDICGNESRTTATFTIQDTTAPNIATEASDFTVECDGNGNLNSLQAWLDANGNALASDLCMENDLIWTNDFTGMTDELSLIHI